MTKTSDEIAARFNEEIMPGKTQDQINHELRIVVEHLPRGKQEVLTGQSIELADLFGRVYRECPAIAEYLLSALRQMRRVLPEQDREDTKAEYTAAIRGH